MPYAVLAQHREHCVSRYTGKQRKAAETSYDAAVEFFRANHARCEGAVPEWSATQMMAGAQSYAQQQCKCIMGILGYFLLQAIIAEIAGVIVREVIGWLWSNRAVACAVIGGV